MNHTIQDVVGMSYFHGLLSRSETLEVCIDHQADGSFVQSLASGAALVQPILRSRLCVRGQIRLAGQDCTPIEYIAAWRAVQARKPQATLDAWFANFETTFVTTLPQPGAPHAHWLSPVYWQACRRLFGPRPHGQLKAEIRSTADILDAIAVLHGRAAFGLTDQSLNESLRVCKRVAAVEQVALTA